MVLLARSGDYSLTLGIVHNGDAYGAPRALLILEAQSDLIKFLRDFVFSMLKSTDEYNMEVVTESLAQTALPSSIQPPLLEDPSWMRFGVSYYNVCILSPAGVRCYTRTVIQTVSVQHTSSLTGDLTNSRNCRSLSHRRPNSMKS